MTLPAINLRMRSSFSPFSSTLSPKSAVALAVADGRPALGIADAQSLAAALSFAKYARDAGVQPIIGCDFQTDSGLITLHARNTVGWSNLLGLSAIAANSDAGTVAIADVIARADGLAALIGGPGSSMAVQMHHDPVQALAEAKQFAAAFGDHAYIEILRDGAPNAPRESLLEQLGRDAKLRLLGSSSARSATGFDASRTLAMLAAIDTKRNLDDPALDGIGKGAHMKTGTELAALFADAPWLLDNATRYALACDPDTAPRHRKPVLPHFPGAAGAEEAMIGDLAAAGLERRLTGIPSAQRAHYRNRFATEMQIIRGQGFSGYFLIVADFIDWSKRQDIPVGPGRGSGAGSIVAWSLGITEIDPIRWNLLFERFINPERVSLPDFDVDFCQDRREEVIGYVRHKYGDARVVGIGTNMTWGGRAAFRDAAKALGIANGAVNAVIESLHHKEPFRIAEMTPDQLAPFRRDPELLAALEMAEPLQGFVRQRGRHAAGIVIADNDVASTVPVMRDPGGANDLVTQYDMKDAEAAGLVKFDFLGLKTLSVIRAAVGHARSTGAVAADFDINHLPFEDDAVFDLLNRGKCHGIFQLETGGMVRSLQMVRPTQFDDLVAIISLYRPGPMEFIPIFAARKAGREAVQVPHPAIHDLVSSTQGILIYQEQIIELVQIMAGYTKGGADILRRAIGKKIQSEMDAQESVFRAGCAGQGHSDALASELWDLIVRFASYGFNRSHAAAYAMITWQTAWLKTHHPAAFYAAAMTYAAEDHDKIRVLVREATERGIAMLPPDILASGTDFRPETTADGRRGVRWGLGAVKGLGYDYASRAVALLASTAPPADIPALAACLAPLGNATVQCRALGACGAIDRLHSNRIVAVEHLVACLRFETGRTGSDMLFELTPPAAVSLPDLDIAGKRAQETAAIGISFHDHPLMAHRAANKRLAVTPVDKLREYIGMGAISVLVRVESCAAQGRAKAVIVRISDPAGEIECITDLPTGTGALTPGALVLAEVSIRDHTSRAKIVAASIFEPATVPRRVRIVLNAVHDWPAIMAPFTAGGRGNDRLDILVDLGGERGKVRRVLPPCLVLTDAALGEVAARSDVFEVRVA